MELRSDIVVDIGEIDLGAVPAARRYQVLATFQRELRRLLAKQSIDLEGWPQDPSERPLRSVAMAVAPDANPVLVGEALARSVVEGLR